jgi:hypothetical protein
LNWDCREQEALEKEPQISTDEAEERKRKEGTVKAREARKLYMNRKGKGQDNWNPEDKFEVRMLGWARWMLKGNMKGISHKGERCYYGFNTNFYGRFSVAYSYIKECWILDYDFPENKWFVRRITDHVRWDSDDSAIGRFRWCGIGLAWFTLERKEGLATDVHR